MLVLIETSAGYAIFKVLDENRLAQSENLYLDFETPERASRIVQLKYFYKFEDTTEALSATAALIEGKLSKSLKKTLRHSCEDVQEQLAVADAKLGNAIKNKLQLPCMSNTAIHELIKGIKIQSQNLLTQYVDKKDMTAMALGLAHSLARYKLKFSPDKIDIMVIQAVCLLDELDKQINNYIMRAREWYGWHFPELSKIIKDNLKYVKTVHIMGQRENSINCDLSDILEEEMESQIRDAAQTSMGSEIAQDDIEHIQGLCNEIIELSDYRIHLANYLNNRMMALAPNLTVLVGDLVGARLISKAGSLTNLAKHPASTLQILGAEKALFRALKSKKNTPKYGLIYHAQLVGQSSLKNKGKISRMLAAKAALATRFDALADNVTMDLGTAHRAKLELQLKFLESENQRRISGTAKAKAKFAKYHNTQTYTQYTTASDSTMLNKPLIEEIDNKENDNIQLKKRKKSTEQTADTVEEKMEEVSKKKKKHKTEKIEESSIENVQTPAESEPKKKKKKKKDSKEPEDIEEPVAEEGSKKKKKRTAETEDTGESTSSGSQKELQIKTEEVPKKKKKRTAETEDTGESISSGSQKELQIKTEEVPKKKKKRTAETEDTGESMSSGVQQELQIKTEEVSKKKKKRIKETEDAGEASGLQAQVEVDSNVVPKKKKKKKQESNKTE